MQFNIPPSVPSSVQTESHMPIPNVTQQMIYSNINDTNLRLQRLEHIMNDKLSKLDLLDMFAEKFEKFENHISKMSNEIDDIRNAQQKHSQIISKQENHHHNIEDRQYPREINDRRKKLIPKMKEFKRQRLHAKLVYDKLLVDEVYNPEAHREPPPTIPGQPLPNNGGD
ncbi:unnamed protein product [Mytilus coruscus]|uniref:Uncharacterized protein n=1 Tax=Mytilus coruscus TaxID=42192 RepID=A0A6J7ZWA5_MYTCO|nr:unnamed protein product [Mytilus coruscus]